MLLMGGMSNTTHLRVLRDTIQIIRELRPVIGRLKKRNAKLADQLERAATSSALNQGEGNAMRGGNRRKHFDIALGSTQEVRVALETAAALGYIPDEIVTRFDPRLDSICARLYRLAGY